MIRIQGCGTALVTPFSEGGALDLKAYRNLVRWQVDSGVHFLVPCGTTGESVTLEEDEYRAAIGACVETASGAVPVVAGAGTNNTAHAIHFARIAEEEGANAILSVTPYYNKPTQEGIFLHFRDIAAAVKIPVIVYNVPGRTGTNISAATTIRLAEVENIIGVKEASGDLDQITEILIGRPPGFAVLSGDDSFTFSIMALGGEGVISVASNVIPAEMSRLVQLASDGQLEEARKIHFRYLPLMNLNFIESSPIPVKYALSSMGKIEEVYRLPLCPLGEGNKQKMDSELEKLHLITARV